MRKFLTARSRRYALAFVVVGASLGVFGACQPTKKEPPPPTPVDPCNGGSGACLTITPTDAAFQLGTIHTFTVTNTGPDRSLRLHRTALDEQGVGGSGVFLINSGPGANTANPDDCQDFHPNGLVLGGKCTIKVVAAGNPGDRGILLVGADNTQLDALTGQRGVSAQLTRN
jgi:hypothetical protein